MTREEAIAEIREKTPALLADYRALAAQIGEALGISVLQGEADDRPEIETDELMELYEAIGEFAEGYDIDSIDTLLEQTKEYRIPEAEKERFDAVVRCVRDSDWDRLKEVLAGAS